MNAAVLLIISIAILLIGYIFYGRWLSKKWGVDPNKATPAHTMEDGVDYVPAKAPVLMGHHFSSIAGAGLINGPIQAAVFGWVPVALWVLIGGIFFGGVHDYGALFASVRNKGKSIGTVIEDSIGLKAKRLFIIFAYLTLLLVVAAFGSIVANTFKATYLENGAIDYAASAANASTAIISIFFIVLAILFGFFCLQKKRSSRCFHHHRRCSDRRCNVCRPELASDLPQLRDLDDHLRRLHPHRIRNACLDPAPAP